MFTPDDAAAPESLATFVEFESAVGVMTDSVEGTRVFPDEDVTVFVPVETIAVVVDEVGLPAI